MWTPKRVLLLVAGFVVFCGAYTGYAQVLGGIDGLPALPDKYCPGDPETGLPLPPVTAIEDRLQQAFGIGCEELKMPIQVESPRGVVIASRDCVYATGEKEVHLTPVSMAFFKTVPNKDPEINTIHGATATLILDSPISGPLDLSKRRVVAATLHGAPPPPGKTEGEPIVIRHLRHPFQKADAIDIQVKQGPVYFDDEKHLIHTTDKVTLQELQSNPDHMNIEGTGLEVHLTPPPQPGDKATPPKAKPEGGGTVERIVLLAAVDMHLYPEAGSGFPALGETPASASPGQAAPGQAKPPAVPPDHIHITTDGPFVYDLARNHGRFDVPDREGPLTSDWVTVIRNPRGDQDDKKKDTLRCQHLELQFRRKTAEPSGKPAAPPPAAEGDGPKLDIEWVHAWGNKIDIDSGEQQVKGEGNDLFYRAQTRTTVLKGSPVAKLTKENVNDIIAPELELIRTPDTDKGKGAQQVTARGTGSIHLWDTKANKRTLHARWRHLFVSAREGEQDVLTFKGGAALVEDEHLVAEDIFSDDKLAGCKSLLKADDLQIWLDPPPAPAPGVKGPPPAPAAPRPGEAAEAHSGGRRPRRVEATGHVEARSPEMHILVGPAYPVTQRLTMHFKDVADPAGPAPVAAKPADPPALPGPQPVVVPAPARPETLPATEPRPSRPVELCAAIITAHVLRYNGGTKTELDRLNTEGAVQVVQAPSGDDKGFHIRGDKLALVRKATGCNHLTVSGDPGWLQTDRNTIAGPQVEIDQAENKVSVDGFGYMTMESTTDFQGNPLKKPEVLEVHWKTMMRFEGCNAELVGDIQAEQGHSRLQCKTLQVEFDKPVSLSDQKKAGNKEPAKGGEPARVKKLVCDRSVNVEEESYETWYKLTDASLTTLRGARVPAAVLERLGVLKDREFDNRDKFTAELARLLAKDELEKVQGLVAAHAAFEPNPPRLTGFRSLDCLELMVENLKGNMTAEGPGTLRIVQPGSGIGTPAGGAAPKAPAKPAAQPGKPAEPEWTLTLVTFGRFGKGRMDADNNRHTASFYENIQVLHRPWTANPKRLRELVNISHEVEKLPAGGLYMECEESLKIYSPPEQSPGSAPRADGTGKHVMTGTGQVWVKATDANGKVFWGTAEVVHYDETKEQVIFDGGKGMAELYQQERQGEEPKKYKGKKIIYWRKDGRVECLEGAQIRGTQ